MILKDVQEFIQWLSKKLFLNSLASQSKKRILKRGQVYRCEFGCGVGSEMRKDRPAVIIQNNIGNINSSNTIVVPITHNDKKLPTIVPLSQYTFVDGQVNVSNIMCVSKARLGACLGELSSKDMKAIDTAIARTIDLLYYYVDLKKKLDDKLNYIEKIKHERNKAQDELNEIRKLLNLSEDNSIKDSINELLTVIDSK